MQGILFHGKLGQSHSMVFKTLIVTPILVSYKQIDANAFAIVSRQETKQKSLLQLQIQMENFRPAAANTIGGM